MMEIDLTNLSTAQLKAIKNVLEHGSLACGMSVPDQDTLATLKKLNDRWEMLREAGVDQAFSHEDDGFILGHSDEHFEIFLNRLIKAKVDAEKEVALAEATKSVKVPPIIGDQRSSIEILREGFKDRRNNGHRQ